jgi:transcriptional regulator with XRE-family HTH domain
MTPQLNSPGKRLRAVRAFCAAARHEFCNKTNLSESTLKSWENDVAKLTRKGANLLAPLFQKVYSVYCTADWLLTGKDPAPIRNVNEIPGQNFSETLLVKQEFENLASYYGEDLVLHKVSDSSMAPFFKIHDWVAGILIEPQDLPYFCDDIILVEVEGYGRLLRKLLKGTRPGVFSLTTLSMADQHFQSQLTDVSAQSAYKILWHRSFLRPAIENQKQKAPSLSVSYSN